MKCAVFFICACLALCAAAPASDVSIVKQDSDVQPASYSYAYETSDGTQHSEQGALKNQGAENEAISVSGQFAYVGPDGQTYTVNYVADENGFQPQGAHLPKV